MNKDELALVRIHALQRAVLALIATHPEPGRFADTLEQIQGQTELLQLGDRHVSEVVRKESREFAQELIEIAREEQARRGRR